VKHCTTNQEVRVTASNWTPTLAWLGAVSAALALAFATPTETSFLGRLPTLTVKRLDQQQLVLPSGLPAERTLALVAFNRSQGEEVRSWIKGLRLDEDSSIAWFKMPVLHDPGSERERSNIEGILLARHPAQSDRSRLVPVFTNREAFLRAAGLPDTKHAWVLVLNRDGQVLARAEGAFDQAKADALRQTLLQND
jgi:hypothetical protein